MDLAETAKALQESEEWFENQKRSGSYNAPATFERLDQAKQQLMSQVSALTKFGVLDHAGVIALIDEGLSGEPPHERWKTLRSVVGAAASRQSEALASLRPSPELPADAKRRADLLFQDAMEEVRKGYEEKRAAALARVAKSGNAAGRTPALAEVQIEFVETAAARRLDTLLDALRVHGLSLTRYREPIRALMLETLKALGEGASEAVERDAVVHLRGPGLSAAKSKMGMAVAGVVSSVQRKLELAEQEEALRGANPANGRRRFLTFTNTYEVISQKGQGGCGRVFEVRAEDGAHFALKELGPEKPSTQRLKRFRNEALVFVEHHHPNLIRVSDVGVSYPEGMPFYVMPLYTESFRDLMKRARGRELFDLYQQMLLGVEAAHALSIVHRDLKPENFLHDASTNTVVVADFGVAHYAEELLVSSVETKRGERLGNYVYSAPEQRVRDGAVDQRADIFALGSILNELFTGSPVHGPGYPRISEVDPAFAFLEPLVDQMVQHQVENRPESVGEIRKAIAAGLRALS